MFDFRFLEVFSDEHEASAAICDAVNGTNWFSVERKTFAEGVIDEGVVNEEMINEGVVAEELLEDIIDGFEVLDLVNLFSPEDGIDALFVDVENADFENVVEEINQVYNLASGQVYNTVSNSLITVLLIVTSSALRFD